MKLSDFEIMEKLGMLISKIYLEGRISENEAGRLSFYGLYNNEYVFNNIYDVDENMCPIDYSSNSNKSDLLTQKEL